MDPSPERLARRRSDRLKRIAESLGFAACGICGPWPIERGPYVRQWIRSGRHGEMAYLAETLETRLDPALLQPGVRSVIVVAWLYRVRETADGLPAAEMMSVPVAPSEVPPVSSLAEEPPPVGALAARADDPSASLGTGSPVPPHAQAGGRSPAGPVLAPAGRIARYAWGRDYHRVMRTRLYKLVDALRSEIREPFKTRVCVDIWPVLERELAARAGIGWIGGNCLVLNRSLGSYFCLGTVLTTLDLAVDQPVPDGCGTCRRCVDACPTGALLEPRRMDARRCLSYLTIEHRGDLPPQSQEALHGQVFGCDICQQVCPYNGPAAPVSIDPDARPRWPAGQVDCRTVLAWGPREWDAILRGRALRRATHEMWQRNARLLLKDIGS